MHNAQCTMRKAWMIMALGLLVCTTFLQAKDLYTVSCDDGSRIYNTEIDGVDKAYVFENIGSNRPTFTTIGEGVNADWYDLTDPTIVSKGCPSFINVNDGHCYRVIVGKDTTTFVVMDYSLHSIAAFPIDSVKMDCNLTSIVYPKTLTMKYGLPDGTTKVWPYTIEVEYMNQVWDSTAVEWQEQECTDSITIDGTGSAVIGANLMDTYFCYKEHKMHSVWHNEDLEVCDTTDIHTAVAVKQHLVYYITKRGTKLENEIEGPYGERQLEAKMVHSAPLDVLFESHPSMKADGYMWTIKKGNDIVTSRNDKDIRYTFDETSQDGPVNYSIDLYIINTHHVECIDSAHMEIDLYSSKILVPNVFTPNGDGVNDEFRVAYQSICEFRCWVYNRWQHLVYSWEDPSKGWDGTINGRPVPASAYIYIIDATGCDGRRFKLKGTVNLLRDYKGNK